MVTSKEASPKVSEAFALTSKSLKWPSTSAIIMWLMANPILEWALSDFQLDCAETIAADNNAIVNNVFFILVELKISMLPYWVQSIKILKKQLSPTMEPWQIPGNRPGRENKHGCL